MVAPRRCTGALPRAARAEPGVPTPAQSVAAGPSSPSPGAHSFGGPENRFGAPRSGHVHEGQDVLTAEGTPVVAPLAGTITQRPSFQAGGAGYYAVEHTAIGFDFMFAHCKAGSLAVSADEAVAAGHALCRPGRPATRPRRTCTSRCGSAAGRPRADTRSIRCRICEAWEPRGRSRLSSVAVEGRERAAWRADESR